MSVRSVQPHPAVRKKQVIRSLQAVAVVADTVDGQNRRHEKDPLSVSIETQFLRDRDEISDLLRQRLAPPPASFQAPGYSPAIVINVRQQLIDRTEDLCITGDSALAIRRCL